MITKKIIAPLLIVILLAGISGVMAAKKTTEKRAEANIGVSNMATDDPALTTMTATEESTRQGGAGRYAAYSEQIASEVGYDTTVLFFHAGWCPECRSFKQAINASTIPDGTQILEVNYDDSSSLRKKHTVTQQSTFVKVDQSGTQLSKWVGYGKEKSLQTVLSNL